MKTIFFMVFACFLLSASEIDQKSLTITVTNIKSTAGNIRVGIYKINNDFPNENDTYTQKIFKISKKGSMLIKIDDLPYGKYAIGIYQDKNKNATLDKSFIGAPKEPFAFSNNVKPMFGAPSFNECSFAYSIGSSKLKVKLLNY